MGNTEEGHEREEGGEERKRDSNCRTAAAPEADFKLMG
jgi:hypothetical protein